MHDQCRRRSFALLLGACLLAGCQPDGAGTMSVDRENPVVRSFKKFDDVKRPSSAMNARKPAGQSSRARSEFQR
jgi:hypothetical protein